MIKEAKGYFFTITAAIGFGMQPMLARYCYAYGVDPFMLAFWRVALMIPVFLLLIFVFSPASIKLTAGQFIKTSFLALTGAVLTTAMLFVAYDLIDTGTATALNFCYPVFVMLISVLVYKDKVTCNVFISFIICIIGILMFVNYKGTFGILGFALALASGVTYGIYIIYLDKSDLINSMGFFSYSFWFFLLSAVMLLPVAGFTGQFSWPSCFKAWFYVLLFSLDGGIVATTFLQIGINIIGGRKASILSAMEPVTSLILGIVLFNETINAGKIVGILLIISSVMILVLGKTEKS